MILRNVLLPGIVLPAVTTALVLFALRGRSAPRIGTAGLALAAGFLSGFVAISGWPRWPPVEATQRLFFLVALIGLLSWPVARHRVRWSDLAFEIAAVVLLLPMILWALLGHSWALAESFLWLGTLFVVCLAISRALGTAVEDGGARPLPIVVRWTLLGTIAAVLGLSESLRLALLSLALASAVAVIDLLTRRGIVTWRRSDALAAATVISGLLLVGYFYAALSAPVAALLVVALGLTTLSDSRSIVVRLSPLLPALLALGLALATFLRPGDDPYDYYSKTSVPLTSGPAAGSRVPFEAQPQMSGHPEAQRGKTAAVAPYNTRAIKMTAVKPR